MTSGKAGCVSSATSELRRRLAQAKVAAPRAEEITRIAEGLRSLAAETAPELRRLLEVARTKCQAVES
jgi:hypothetical protein